MSAPEPADILECLHDDPPALGVCQMAIVLDPDGNALTIHKRGAQ